MQKFKIIATTLQANMPAVRPEMMIWVGKPLQGENYVEGKKERRRKKINNAKFSGHYVYPRTETVRAHALRSHQ